MRTGERTRSSRQTLSSATALASARASSPSLPGAAATQWSAFEAVRFWRGVTAIRRAPPSRVRGRDSSRAGGVLGRRAAGVEEVRAEIDDQIRSRTSKIGAAETPKTCSLASIERVLAEGLVGQTAGDARRGRTDRSDPSSDGPTGHRGSRSRRGASELGGKLALRIFPGDRLERAVAAAGRRPVDAIGMIGAAEPRLATSAQSGPD